VSSNSIMFIPKFMKLGQLVQKLKRVCVRVHTHTHKTQHGVLMNLGFFLKKRK
jgi:hypothetical protein